ncbi:MAG: hypothetical protein IJU52_05835 [Clostridia bacterium]|nr:hypothetical protein [Clostridia bacterium]
MKENKYFEALTDVDDALIREAAAPPASPARLPSGKKTAIVLIAAALALTLLCAVLIPMLAKKNEAPPTEDPVTAEGPAASGSVTLGGMTFSRNPDSASYTLTEVGKTPGSNVILFETVNGLPVTEIGENALSGATAEYFYIPSSVTVIAPNAFSGCATLKALCYSGSESAWHSAFDGKEEKDLPHDVEVLYDPFLPTTDEPYVYPVTPGSDEWKALSLPSRREVCRVSRPILESMTTNALIVTVVTYPFFVDVYVTATGSTEAGLEAIGRYFDGVTVLSERQDAEACLRKYIESRESQTEDGSFSLYSEFAKTLLAHVLTVQTEQTSDDGQTLRAGVYRRSGSGDYPALRLYEDRTYSTGSNALSSLLMTGEYSVKEGFLYFRSGFVFKILENGDLMFSEEKSGEWARARYGNGGISVDIEPTFPIPDGTLYVYEGP